MRRKTQNEEEDRLKFEMKGIDKRWFEQLQHRITSSFICEDKIVLVSQELMLVQ